MRCECTLVFRCIYSSFVQISQSVQYTRCDKPEQDSLTSYFMFTPKQPTKKKRVTMGWTAGYLLPACVLYCPHPHIETHNHPLIPSHIVIHYTGLCASSMCMCIYRAVPSHYINMQLLLTLNMTQLLPTTPGRPLMYTPHADRHTAQSPACGCCRMCPLPALGQSSAPAPPPPPSSR